MRCTQVHPSSHRSKLPPRQNWKERNHWLHDIGDGSQNISIDGLAFSHADITNFINNLNEKSLIEQANLLSAKALEQSEQSTSNKMGFTILCKLKDV